MTQQRNDQKLTRRGFVAGVGAAAAAIVGPTVLDAAPAGAETLNGAAVQPGPPLPDSLQLNEIQGNILGGFNKDYQALLFVTFGQQARARQWLSQLKPKLTTSATVAAYQQALVAGTAKPVTWVNVAVSAAGMTALGVDPTQYQEFPLDFREGMAARASIVGDVGPNAPAKWAAPFRKRLHAVVIIGADKAADRDAAVAAQRTLAGTYGVVIEFVQNGAVRADDPGHEHFGFRDGISQPGVRGFTQPVDPVNNPNQGIPGQDLLWPGEFVIGYPRQGGVGAGTNPGPRANSGPAWALNGAYLVFRRLAQDVDGFRRFMKKAADDQGISVDLMGAKVVGRYRSGAPLETTGNQAVDPGIADPSLVSDAKVNDFEFGEDPDGTTVPLAAHIRKTYPRDEPTADGGEEDTQTHRIMRRGIPYGTSLPRNAPSPSAPPSFPNDRGLLFLCYQSSIARQFEFVQRRWVNDPNFPRAGAGHDPVMSQVDGPRFFSVPGTRTGHVELMSRFVTTTGGDYFFQPSITAVGLLAAGTTTPPRPPTTTTAPPKGR